ncbi:MAG: hypothetical protein V4490_03025 [Pseudomonadota bacterium]
MKKPDTAAIAALNAKIAEAINIRQPSIARNKLSVSRQILEALSQAKDLTSNTDGRESDITQKTIQKIKKLEELSIRLMLTLTKESLSSYQSSLKSEGQPLPMDPSKATQSLLDKNPELYVFDILCRNKVINESINDILDSIKAELKSKQNALSGLLTRALTSSKVLESKKQAEEITVSSLMPKFEEDAKNHLSTLHVPNQLVEQIYESTTVIRHALNSQALESTGTATTAAGKRSPTLSPLAANLAALAPAAVDQRKSGAPTPDAGESHTDELADVENNAAFDLSGKPHVFKHGKDGTVVTFDSRHPPTGVSTAGRMGVKVLPTNPIATPAELERRRMLENVTRAMAQHDIMEQLRTDTTYTGTAEPAPVAPPRHRRDAKKQANASVEEQFGFPDAQGADAPASTTSHRSSVASTEHADEEPAEKPSAFAAALAAKAGNLRKVSKPTEHASPAQAPPFSAAHVPAANARPSAAAPAAPQFALGEDALAQARARVLKTPAPANTPQPAPRTASPTAATIQTGPKKIGPPTAPKPAPTPRPASAHSHGQTVRPVSEDIAGNWKQPSGTPATVKPTLIGGSPRSSAHIREGDLSNGLGASASSHYYAAPLTGPAMQAANHATDAAHAEPAPAVPMRKNSTAATSVKKDWRQTWTEGTAKIRAALTFGKKPSAQSVDKADANIYARGDGKDDVDQTIPKKGPHTN